jgi:hypothetical protein
MKSGIYGAFSTILLLSDEVLKNTAHSFVIM